MDEQIKLTRDVMILFNFMISLSRALISYTLKQFIFVLFGC